VVLLYPIVLILAIHQPKIVYDTLFETTWKRCNNLAKKEIQAGKIAVLHTWGQQSLHLHLYCIVPSGGINKEGNGKTAEGTVNFCSL
jgi:hypothetical protein